MSLAIYFLRNIWGGWWWRYWYFIRILSDVRIVVDHVVGLVRNLDAIISNVGSKARASFDLSLEGYLHALAWVLGYLVLG